MSIFRNLQEALHDCCFIWWDEIRQTVKDEGVLIFFILVPLLYPLLYSWIYNNEVVREVPVVVVDDCHSQLSRRFVRQCDASPDVKILAYASDLDEAKSLLSRQVARGIYYFPSDFDANINRGQQATVGVYCDMSLMLCYKAVFQTAQSVSTLMGAELQTRLGQHFTTREEQIAARPLAFDEVPIFNPTGGYGSFIIPGVLMLIIQQTLVLGIGLSAGTARERNRYRNLIPISRHYNGMFRIVGGKAMAYFMIYAVMTAYLVLLVPRFFSFTAIGHWQDLVLSLCRCFSCRVSAGRRAAFPVSGRASAGSSPALSVSGASYASARWVAHWPRCCQSIRYSGCRPSSISLLPVWFIATRYSSPVRMRVSVWQR